MGCIGLFCCYRTCRPTLVAIVGLVTNLIAIIFLIWALADLPWFTKAPKVLYIIAFVLICLCFICFIIIFILLNLRTGPNYLTYNNIGKILCLLIIGMSILAFIFLLIGGIIELAKMVKYREFCVGHDWAALFIPTILGLIACIIMALCANYLYTIFNLNILSTLSYHQYTLQTVVNPNSTTTIPNTTPVIINNAATPPVVVNTKPVIVQ